MKLYLFLSGILLFFFTSELLGQNYSVRFNGKERTYKITLPNNYSREECLPLVLVLHGYHNEVESMGRYTEFDQKAKDERFIVAYPRGTINENAYYIWNAGNIYNEWTNNANDIGFIDTLIKKTISDYNVDDKRIYIAGHSNGAMMAYRLAKTLPDKFAAVACVSGPMIDNDPAPKSPVAIMHIHGDNDMVVPHTGTTQYGFQMNAVDETLKNWIKWNDCSTVPAVLKYDKRITGLQWKGNAIVSLYLLHNHGHDWPTDKRCGWSATDHIWEFFVSNSQNMD